MWKFLFCMALLGCTATAAPGTPANACADIAQTICKREAACGALADSAVPDCTNQIATQLNCAGFTCAAGKTYSVNAYDQCVADINNEDCPSVISGVSAGCSPLCQ